MSKPYTDADVQTLAALICDDTTGGHSYTPAMWDELTEGDDRHRLLADARRLLDAVAPTIAARALREVADKWSRGQWADAPRCADRVQERIANGQHVGDWLRAHADAIESATP